MIFHIFDIQKIGPDYIDFHLQKCEIYDMISYWINFNLMIMKENLL